MQICFSLDDEHSDRLARFYAVVISGSDAGQFPTASTLVRRMIEILLDADITIVRNDDTLTDHRN